MSNVKLFIYLFYCFFEYINPDCVCAMEYQNELNHSELWPSDIHRLMEILIQEAESNGRPIFK